jgi:hypothetical protein
LGVAAQPPLSKSFWRRWSASPLLLKRALSPQLQLRKKWWPQKRRRALHRLLVLQKGEDHVWFEDRWMVASLCDE